MPALRLATRASDEPLENPAIPESVLRPPLGFTKTNGEAVDTVALRWPRFASAALRFALVVAAGWALRRELAETSPQELTARLVSYGPPHVLLGLACTAASFLVLGIIEIIALRHARSATAGAVGSARVPRAAAMTTAFVANALSQSVGVALLTGAAVRLRAYARRGLDAVSVGRVTAFATLTTTLGLLAAGAASLVRSSEPIHMRGFSVSVRPLGGVLALLVIAYVGWAAFGKGAALGRGRWRLNRPSLPLAIAQVGLSTLDWILTGTVLFAFVPDSLGVGYWAVMRAYMIAQTIGVTSHVPGGVGVLEVVLLALLTSSGTADERAAVVASLVMFRVVYYLVPLIAAMIVAGVAELRRSVRANRGVAAVAHSQ